MAAAALAPGQASSEIFGHHAEPFERRMVAGKQVPDDAGSDWPALPTLAHS